MMAYDAQKMVRHRELKDAIRAHCKAISRHIDFEYGSLEEAKIHAEKLPAMLDELRSIFGGKD